MQYTWFIPLVAAIIWLPTANAASGSWAVTGSMSTGRMYHTATRLPNGKVLVTGSWGGSNGGISSVEIYTPSTGAWSNAAAMTDERSLHTATLLTNSKVLITGGEASNTLNLNSAELFDYSTGLWSDTASMAQGRFWHTATTLTNGNVIVAGGFNVNNSGPQNGTELYNIATGTWNTSGNLISGRNGHIAALLANGKVLVAGGQDNSGSVTNSAELLDPTSNTWSNTGAMSEVRQEARAVLLTNGKVLVTGGYDFDPSYYYLATAELYNPATGTWSNTGAMTTARASHTITLLNTGKVLVAGGKNNSGDVSSAELYDPATGTWISAGTMNTGRFSHTATLLANGKVLVAGGRSNTSLFSTSAELYTPVSSNNTDLKLLLTDNRISINPGATTIYLAAITNLGPATANNALLKAPAIANLTITGVTCGTVLGGAVCPISPTVALLQGSGIVIPTLPVNSGLTFRITARVAAAATGNINYAATVVAPTGITDTNTGNNTARDINRVMRQPDLIVTNIVLTPAIPSAAGTFSAAITVKNQGTAIADGSFIDVWANQPAAQVCNAAGNNWLDVGSVAAGATKTLIINGLSAGVAGSKTLRAFVDSWCEIIEANEINNQFIKSYTVQ